MRGREEREALRKSYLPDTVRVLFVGESPPQGGTFFYASDSILFNATRNGFLAAFPEKDFVSDFLPKFKKLGCYLDDLSAIPINKLSEPEKRFRRRDGEGKLAQKLRQWQPTAIIVVMKGVESHVRAAVDEAGVGTVEFFEALSFPVRGRFQEYVDGLEVILQRLDRERLLDPSLVS